MLNECKCNIWSLLGTHKIVVTTNLLGVMGAGLARQAKQRYDGIELYYRWWLRVYGSKGKFICESEFYPDVVLFPTKTDWRLNSNLMLIERGLSELSQCTNGPYAIPELGCGLGKLKWEQVKPLYEVLRPSKTEFLIVHPG